LAVYKINELRFPCF